MRGELRCPACKHDWATAARADSANHGNHAGHSSYSRRGVLPLLALSARAVDHIRVTILRAAFTAALALGAYTTPLAAHAAAPTRALPGPLSAGRSAIPVGCGCAGSAARRSAPLSVARAPPRGAPARRTARSAWDQLRRTARRRARADRLRLRASSSSCQTSSELGHALVPRVPPVSLAGLPWSSVPLALRELLDFLLRHRLQP